LKIRLATTVRSLGFLLGGLMAIAAALGLFVWISFDADEASETLSRYFQENYQRTLVLSEAPHLSIWPRPALSLGKVSLGEAGQNQTFASVNELRIELAILPLFHHRFELLGLRAKGLTLHLRQLPTGKWNLADLLAPSDADALPGWSNKLEKIVLRETTASIETLGRTKPFELEALDLDARLPANGNMGNVSWKGSFQDSVHNSALTLEGGAKLALSDGLRAGHLQDLHLNLDGDSHGLNGATLRLSTRHLAWHALGDSGELNQLELRIRGARSARAVDISGVLPNLSWQGRALSGKDLSARLDLRTVSSHSEFKLNVPALAPDAPNGSLSSGAMLDWQHQSGDDSSTSLQLAFDGHLDLLANTLDATELKGELKLHHPGLRDQQAQALMDGSFTWQADGLALKTRFKSGEDSLRLGANLQNAWPLTGNFTLDASSFDLDRLLAESAPGKPHAALPWPAPEGANLEGQLRLAGVRAGGLSIDALQGPLKIQDGKLSSERLLARIHGGQISGSLLAEATSQRVSSQGEFSELPVERIALESGLPLPLAGKANGSYKLAAKLGPGAPITTTLDGVVRWNLSQAGLRGLDIGRGLRELLPAINAGRMSARSPKRDENSDLVGASSRFVFEGGKLKAEQIEARSKWLKLSGSGQADLALGEMDFRFQASLLPGLPQDLLSLRGKTLPLRIKGPPMQPDLRFEPQPAKGRS